MKEVRKINHEDLMQLCISQSWYTKGSKEQFENLLDYADSIKNVTTENIIHIAKNILEHSNQGSPLELYCYAVAKICHSFFEQ
jgi:hypothetical protein